MKKLIYLIVAIAALGLIVSGCIPVVPPAEQSNIDNLTKADITVSPGESIQDAITAARSGDTIKIAAGTYVEQIIIDKSITLQGASKETTIIEYPPAPVSDQYLIMVQADDVTITGFKLLCHFATSNRAVERWVLLC